MTSSTSSNYSIEDKKKIITLLSEYITQNKRDVFSKVLENRTRHLTVVLEDIYQPHNASAVMRSCDCFGIQDLHIIENKYSYKVNPNIVMGASKWVNTFTYNHTLTAINELKSKGYRIVIANPGDGAYNPDNLPLDQKTALIFGTEKTGLTDVAIANADDVLSIPSYGFTQSFNISVSAAIILHVLTERLHRSSIDWWLNNEEKTDLHILWLSKLIAHSDQIIEAYVNKSRKLH